MGLGEEEKKNKNKLVLIFLLHLQKSCCPFLFSFLPIIGMKMKDETLQRLFVCCAQAAHNR